MNVRVPYVAEDHAGVGRSKLLAPPVRRLMLRFTDRESRIRVKMRSIENPPSTRDQRLPGASGMPRRGRTP